MSDELAEIIEELTPPNENHLWGVLLSNGYLVSTIKRTEKAKQTDEAISMLMKLHGVTPEDIGHVGVMDMPGDYETMVFLGNDRTELAFARYETKDEAEQGHEEMVERWRRMPPPEECPE